MRVLYTPVVGGPGRVSLIAELCLAPAAAVAKGSRVGDSRAGVRGGGGRIGPRRGACRLQRQPGRFGAARGVLPAGREAASEVEAASEFPVRFVELREFGVDGFKGTAASPISGLTWPPTCTPFAARIATSR